LGPEEPPWSNDISSVADNDAVRMAARLQMAVIGVFDIKIHLADGIEMQALGDIWNGLVIGDH
jgi:hypothetical protein